jgi:PGF-pre-PGF domain-containing protein
MKTAKGILLCLLLTGLILALVFAPITGAISSTSKVMSIPHANSTSFGIATAMDVPVPPVHNWDTLENFFTIQAAIYDSNTNDGHTIEVDPGTYRENVKVNKTITIRATSGNPTDTIVQAVNAKDHVFTITADSVKLSGFTIKGATGDNKSGIHLSSADNIIIENNVSFNFIGIALSGSRGNSICNNTANTNSYAGFAFFDASDNNMIANNTARDNNRGLIFYPFGGGSFNTITNNLFDRNYDGISIWGLDGPSDNNVIVNNSVTFNKDGGLFIINSSDNIIENNNFSHTQWYSGIELRGFSSNNKINNNVANSNGGTGISLLQTKLPGSPSNNTITNNSACFNKYTGIRLTDSASYNTITNNYACFNNGSGIALFYSCSNNMVSNNKLYSNLIGLSIKGADISNNQIVNNTVSLSNSYGIWLADLRYTNAITNNNISKSNLFGILALNSTNIKISDNTANLNERGIGLNKSSEIHLINNSAESNEIAGFSLINSTNNILVNNSARFNTYEGIYLSNSRLNKISNNNVSSSYFGISVYSSNKNDIINNVAESNYYFEVFLYSSTSNNITNNTWYTQEDIIRGIRLYVPNTLTPPLQTVEPATNATYYLIVENLGNMRDTYDLNISSIDNPEVLCLNKDIVTLDAGEISAHIFSGLKFETIKLNVSDTVPGIYRAKVEGISRNDNSVKDAIETLTIVQGTIDTVPINTTITNAALIKSAINKSIIKRSAIINSIISDSTIKDSIIKNSTVIDTSLNGVIVEDAIVNAGNMSAGTITLNGIRYAIDNGAPISGLVLGTDYSDSNLVGITVTKTLDVYAENTNVSFDISAKEDYFAGSMQIQKSYIPPEGIPEDTNTVGGYIYADASDNLVNSTSWLILKVFYDQNELGTLDESTLRLRYFNESAGSWEDLPVSGINLTGDYVWCNITHYSVFALLAQPAAADPSGGSSGGTSSPPEEVIILVANPGINNFNFEWLGLDILEVTTDLERPAINARVALKKMSKTVEIPDPQGIVYLYYEITTNLKSENIKSAAINFRVSKSWIENNEIATLKMYRYTEDWKELKTEKVNEDKDYIYYTVETPGLSIFVITGERETEEVTPLATTPTPSVQPTTSLSPLVMPAASPVPSAAPASPALISGIGLRIIAVIVASAMIILVAYFLLRGRKKKLS